LNIKNIFIAGTLFLMISGCSSNQVADEVKTDYQSTYQDLSVDAQAYSSNLDADAYIDALVRGGSSRLDPRLPNYTYFQGVIHAQNHIIVAGQVRVVGGLLGNEVSDATTSLYRGAMVTTNPYAFTGAGDSMSGGTPGMKTRIDRWEEIENP